MIITARFSLSFWSGGLVSKTYGVGASLLIELLNAAEVGSTNIKVMESCIPLKSAILKTSRLKANSEQMNHKLGTVYTPSSRMK